VCRALCEGIPSHSARHNFLTLVVKRFQRFFQMVIECGKSMSERLLIF